LIVGGEKDGKKSGDQYEEVYKDKHVLVHKLHQEQIGGSMSLHVGGIDDGDGQYFVSVEGDKAEKIQKKSHLHVLKDRMEKVDGKQSLTVGGDQHEKVGMNHALEAGQAIHLKGGMTVVIEAGTQLSLKVGGNFIDINPAGIFIQGTLVNINSGGAPGVGSGSSPTAPTDTPDVFPTEPIPADSHKTGQKSTPY
jgi:type VI secretion system secreted protein VgrG